MREGVGVKFGLERKISTTFVSCGFEVCCVLHTPAHLMRQGFWLLGLDFYSDFLLDSGGVAQLNLENLILYGFQTPAV